MKVAVLGINGMLGWQMLTVCQQSGLNTVGFSHAEFDAEHPDFSLVADCEYVINCIGIIKPYIHDQNSAEITKAITVNSLFPHALAKTNAKIIQIATDCVWDGVRGNYLETDPHNATDVYGKSKSLGEVSAANVLNLRCSIIGLEQKGYLSLLEWFLHQPLNTTVQGYLNHLWNGLTTKAFSKICVGLIQNHSWFAGLAHIVPADIVSKAKLLHLFAEHFQRHDIQITDINAHTAVNRTIATNNPKRNAELWNNAGYRQIPSISQMIAEIALP